MKRTIAYALVFLTTLLGAFGGIYHGTITQTVTATNDPLYQIGQTFVGSYQYESTSVDGTFLTDPVYSPKQPGVNYSLSGLLYTPFATEAHFNYLGVSYQFANGPGGSFKDFLNTPTIAGKLVVSNGDVSGFDWFYDNGGFYMQMSGISFKAMSYYDKGPISQVPITSGTVVFGKPTSVPEVTATLPLLVGVFFVLRLIRRHFAT